MVYPRCVVTPLMGRISSCPGVVITELMLSSLMMYSGLYHHAAHYIFAIIRKKI